MWCVVFGVCAVYIWCVHAWYICVLVCVLNSACVVYAFVLCMGFLWGGVVYVCSVFV